MRNERSLSGAWEFQLDPDGSLTVDSLSPDRQIQVPMPWQAAFPELQRYSGYGWYRKAIELGQEWFGGEVLLRFGAVDYWCQVFVNGKLVGEHEGGYTPITLPVGNYLHVGRNEIAVRVYDSVQSEIKAERWPEYGVTPTRKGPPFDANDLPHGKQEWYINVGGIWQDVSITAVTRTYIENVAIFPDIHTGEALVKVRLAGEMSEGRGNRLQVEINGSGGEKVGSGEAVDVSGFEYELRVAVEDVRLWTTSDPYLYTASVSLRAGDGEDTVDVRFGFREIKVRDGQIWLNEEPIYLLAALDQDLYPETIYTVPSVEFLRDSFKKAQELGLNCLRCHIKPPDPRYLDLADEMGLLVWAEIPSWRTFAQKGTVHAQQLDLGPAIKERVERTLEEMVRRDFNHPSLIIWTIVNEDWGTALPLSSEDRTWVASMYDYCKRLDPTRLVVDNSACPHPWGPNIHVKSDLDDFHVYANIPEGARSFAQTMDQFGLRPLWTYSTHGDATRTGQEPLILSEFGNWGLPLLGQLRDKDGKDPSWFEIGPWWSPWEGESGWASGVEERFHKLGLDAIWRDYEDFARATQWHQFAAMKFEIEALRRQCNVEGYVITEFTDTYWESNGLLDFKRNPKAYHNDFAAINAPNMIIPQTERYSYWDDQKFLMHPHVVRYTGGEWQGGRLRWNVEDTDLRGECNIASLERTVVETLEPQSVDLPQVESTQAVKLDLRLENNVGESIARNSVELLVLPASMRKVPDVGMVTVVTRHNRIRRPATGSAPLPDIPVGEPGQLQVEVPPVPRGAVAEGRAGLDLEVTLETLGYRTNREITSDTNVVVSNFPNAELLHWVREGGDLLFLSLGASPFYWVQSRGGVYGGNWITSFSWIRPEVHKRLKATNPIGLPFVHTVPTRTILGLPFEDAEVQRDFLAGSVSGWVRHPSIHTVQFRYGKGRVIMTTFALEENLLQDPTATAMLHDLIEYLCSDTCQPKLAANY